MTDSQLARRQGAAPRPFGSLPPVQTSGFTLERALELAGVDATELALLASTTFQHAKTLEELVSLVASTRRRGLDGLQRQVYYEHFGGSSNPPSLHTAIDGLRAIAAATGRYAGSSEPRFSGSWDMDKKVVPEKCTVTVYAIVQTRTCAFDGTAWMEESYPGPGPRGDMWRKRPRGMLSIAAERQALRKAFPSETRDIGDADDPPETEPVVPPAIADVQRSVAANALMHDRIFGQEEDPSPTKRQRPLEDLVGRYQQRLAEACDAGLIPEEDLEQWVLPEDATREVVLEYGLRVADLVEHARLVRVGDQLADELAELIEAAAAGGVAYEDARIGLPAPEAEVKQAVQRLQQRISEAMEHAAAGD